MPIYHIAQVNIGRVRAPIEDPLMAGFVSRLDEINALADHSPGFVWRLQTPVGNATYFRPYPEDDRILINMSVWESIAALRHYVYKTAHSQLLRQREAWFEKFEGVYMAPVVGSSRAPSRSGRSHKTPRPPGKARAHTVCLHVQKDIRARRAIPAGNRLVVIRAVPRDLATTCPDSACSTTRW